MATVEAVGFAEPEFVPEPSDEVIETLYRFRRGRRCMRYGGRLHALARHGRYCAYCGRDLLADVDSLLHVSLDHFIPQSAGGGDSLDNIVLSCYFCNVLKNNTVLSTIGEAADLVASRRREAEPILEVARWLVSDAGSFDELLTRGRALQ